MLVVVVVVLLVAVRPVVAVPVAVRLLVGCRLVVYRPERPNPACPILSSPC